MRLKELRAQGLGLLGEGRHREAALVFERLLLQDPADATARRGLESARALASDAARDEEARLHAVDVALARGERALARRLLEELQSRDADPDALGSRLERLEARRGAFGLPAPATASSPAEVTGATVKQGPSRRAFAAVWCVLLLVLGAGVASSWDRLVTRLVETPAPNAHPVPPGTRLPQPTAGERALAQARESLERGELRAALASLDRIAADDPAYPFARQLRERVALQRSREPAP